MCIRDRLRDDTHVNKQFVENESFRRSVGDMVYALTSCGDDPVSYTHLDVYKRQVLRKHGFSLRRIAAEVGCAVNTVRSHLVSGVKPKYERQKQRLAKLLSLIHI